MEEEIETYILPPRKICAEEAKLATERLAKEQIKVAAVNRKIIKQLKGFLLDSVSGLEEESLPFEVFLDKINQTDTTKLRKYSVKNSVRVTRLTQLHQFASRVHTTGDVPIRSKLWDRANKKDV